MVPRKRLYRGASEEGSSERKITMVTVGTDSYVTVEEADAYIAEHFLPTDEQRKIWEKAGNDKEIALRRACAALDSLMYRGVKYSISQTLAFPRYFGENYIRADGTIYFPNINPEVPRTVKAAQIEEALEIISPTEATEDKDIRNNPVQSYSIGHLSETFEKVAVGSLQFTLASVRAQELIRPYTGGGYEVR